jgi:NAD(P)H-dependent flavin oxidoreductase YrpB (nitropropane dioxygenase family)
MLTTPLCRLLGIEHPIFSVGMGTCAGPELAAAVSSAGACGVLGTAGLPAKIVRQQIGRLRSLTDKPFGVNRILDHSQEGQLEACFEARIPLLVLFWGDPGPYVRQAHDQGTKVFMQVGSVDEAKAAADAGVDAIIAQGVEAGGHVKGTVSLSALLPAVVAAVQPIPVIASGGIATGQGLVAALSLGAQGVSVGTRFLASEEAFIPPEYKERILRSRAEDTVYCELFDIGWPAPHRVLRNKAVAEWEAAGRALPGRRPGEGTIIGTLPRGGKTVDVVRYSAMVPAPGFVGDLEYTALYCGESCALVNDIKPAALIVRGMVREAEQAIAEIRGT